MQKRRVTREREGVGGGGETRTSALLLKRDDKRKRTGKREGTARIQREREIIAD